MPTLGGELLVSFGMVAVTVVLHLVGLMGVLRLTRFQIEKLRSPWLALDRLLVPLVLATALFVLHGAEVWLYALVYWQAEATVGRGLEVALYISASAYSTAGWLGAQLKDGWRVVGALESLNGMLLLGWSTAFLFQTLHRVLTTDKDHPLPEGAIAADSQEEEADEADSMAADSADSESPRPSGSGRGAPVGTN